MATRFANTKKARKRWRCNGCGRIIQPGEQYRYSYELGCVNERHDCAQCVARESEVPNGN